MTLTTNLYWFYLQQFLIEQDTVKEETGMENK
jgi:hypothetical protein